VALTFLVTVPGSDPQTITLDQPRVVIGRGAHVDVRLPSRAVSDQHAMVRVDGPDVSIIDEGSTNGTRVNGVAIARGRRKFLRDGDEIGVGDYAIKVSFVIALADPPERTATLARRLLRDSLRSLGGDSAPPYLELRSGKTAGRRWEIPAAGSRLTLGRAEGCEVLLDDRDCSRQHAEVERDAEGFLLRDLGSKNGIVVGGRSLTEKRLKNGDEFTIGKSTLRFVDPTEELLRGFESGADEAAPPPPPRPSMPPPTPSIPPPPAEPAVALAAATPAPDAKALRERKGDADWIVLALAVVILVVSVAALVIVLKG
jgi:pSer/pThr/pTyr-binding forkhead associated (FHA) protein